MLILKTVAAMALALSFAAEEQIATRLIFKRECSLYTSKHELIKKYPGGMCEFLASGQFLSATEKGLTLFGKDDRKIWYIPGFFHHQIKTTPDEKTILAMKYKNFNVGDKISRFDEFQKIDFNGNVLAQQDSRSLLEQVHMPLFANDKKWDLELDPTLYESTHFNSMYEIPKHSNAKAQKILPSGGYILNSLFQGVFIVTSDLKKVVYHLEFKGAKKNHMHDVQVTPEGTILAFVNDTRDEKNPNQFSTIQEFDPLTQRVLWKFSGRPAELFYSPFCGGVQYLDRDRILFSDVNKGVYIYDRKKKDVIYYSYDMGLVIDRDFTESQEIKARDYRPFLKARGE